LELPPADRPLSPADLIGFAAVRLFVERVRATGTELPLTRETMPDVAAICRRLDGLPLALELAATWTKTLSPAGLLARLDPILPLLTGGPRDHPARLRTMAGAIAWSYGLLTPEEQRFFRHCAVFVGGFTLDAAEAVGRSITAWFAVIRQVAPSRASPCWRRFASSALGSSPPKAKRRRCARRTRATS
jgi:predicted ATPase